jgi:hypothetical protein
MKKLIKGILAIFLGAQLALAQAGPTFYVNGGIAASPFTSLYDGPAVNASYYGVVGDGSTDNNSSTSGFLQTAINALCASSSMGRGLRLPAGVVKFSTSLTLPTTCTRFLIMGPGSGGRTGSLTSALGTTRLSYTGTGAALVLGTEATPARTTITSASRASNVLTIVTAYNSVLAGLNNTNQVMVRGLVPTDMNTEDLYLASVTTDGSTEVTLTINFSGTTESASSVTGAYVDYAWNDNSYYANSSSGWSIRNLSITCDSGTRTQLLNYQSYTDSSPDTGSNHQTYATTAYAIQAWRGPNLTISYVEISGCFVGFLGTNSDEDTFDHARGMNNKIAFWHSSQDSQTEFDFPYTSGNDVAIQLDGALNVTVRHWTSDTDGSSSTSALTLLGNQQARNTVGFQCYDCWFENNHGSTISAYKSYVSAGEAGPTTVLGVDFDYPMFSMPVVPTSGQPQTVSFMTIGNADGIHIRYPININHTGSNIQPSPFLNFTGSYSPQNVRVILGGWGLTTPYTNTGTGNPLVAFLQDDIYYEKTVALATSIATGCSLIPGSAWTVPGVTSASHVGWSYVGDAGGTVGGLIVDIMPTSSGTVVGRVCNWTGAAMSSVSQSINWWVGPYK